MNHTHTVQEQLSALADGHLQGVEASGVVAEVRRDPQLLATWQTYHVIGDVLRSGAHLPCSDMSTFVSRLSQQLASERVVPVVAVPDVRVLHRVEASNESEFRWKLVAGVASIAAATAIGWSWVGTTGAPPAGVQLAQQQAPTTAGSVETARPAASVASVATPRPMRVVVGGERPQVMLRDARLDQLLEAHQQAGGASQMPSGFLRNATFDGPSQ